MQNFPAVIENAAALVAKAVETNPCAVYLAGLTGHHSRRSMQAALRRGLRVVGIEAAPMAAPWATLRYEHVQAVKAALQENGLAPASVNQTLAALRGVVREAWRLGQMDSDAYRRIADVGDVKNRRLPPGKIVGYDALSRLFAVCAADPSPAGRRDAALFGVLFGCGLRRSEVVALDLAALQEDEGGLRVRGKGDKDRLCYLTNGSADAVAAWVAVRGSAPGPLFVRIGKGSRMTEARLSDQAVRFILEARADQAGIPVPRPHDARRTFVTTLLDRGNDALIVAKLAGHADVRTTMRYDRRDEHAKRRAAESLDVPFRG